MGCSFFCTNKWWEGGPKEGGKNFLKRLVFAIVSVFRTVTEYTVLLAILLAVAFFFFAAWLNTTADIQERKANQPLIDFDVFLDDVIDNLNYLTQVVPNQAIEFANETLYKVGSIGDEAIKGSTRSLNAVTTRFVNGVEDAVNQATQWGCDQGSVSNCPQVSLNPPTIPSVAIADGWQPSLTPVDLTSIRIPPKGFSIYQELSPFIHEVYNVPRVVAYYVEYAAIILTIYAGFRVLISLLRPFLPLPDFTWCCGISCIKVIQVSSLGVRGFFAMLAKPFVHVPLVFGILLILLVELWLSQAIDDLNTEIRKPLKEADVATAEFLGLVNNFIQQVPRDIIDWVNEMESTIWSRILLTINPTLIQVYSGINDALLNYLETPINQFLWSLDSSLDGIFIQPFGIESPLVKLPPAYLPSLPYIPTDYMKIPADLLGIEKPVSPWVDDRIQELHDIANSILLVGIWLVIIPGCFCLWGFGKAFIPHRFNEFINHPDFYETSSSSGGASQGNRQLP